MTSRCIKTKFTTFLIYNIFCACMLCVKLIISIVLERLLKTLVPRQTSRTFYTCTWVLLNMECFTNVLLNDFVDHFFSTCLDFYYLCTIKGRMIHWNYILSIVKVLFLVHYLVFQKWYYSYFFLLTCILMRNKRISFDCKYTVRDYKAKRPLKQMNLIKKVIISK